MHNMVHAYHVIWGMYGFWLPNDPRGSWSDYVRAWELLRFGSATQVQTRRSLAHEPHDRALRQQARESLRYTPVKFTGLQARSAAIGFAEFVRKSNVSVYACAILPEHVHMVIGRHTYPVERVVMGLKGMATRQLQRDRLHPLAHQFKPDQSLPSPWCTKCWKVFLNDDAHIRHAIRYVDDNPSKEGLPRQSWSFVMSYTGE